MQPSELCVPIYLNQRIVFDHLAIIEDGFSQFATVTSASSAGTSSTTGAEGGIGLGNIFGLLDIKFGGRYERAGEKSDRQETETQRTHTPASLFSKLRSYLESSNLLKTVRREEDLSELASGDIVEFQAVLRQSPLIGSLEAMVNLLDIAITLSGEGQTTKNKRSVPITDNQKMLDMMKDFLERLQGGGTVELIADIVGDERVRAVLSSKLDYFVDRDSSELIDGEFRVIGKVIRSLSTPEAPPINLLRKTPLRAVGDSMLEQFRDTFNNLEDTSLNLPRMVTAIEPPACQVLPIAIFA